MVQRYNQHLTRCSNTFQPQKTRRPQNNLSVASVIDPTSQRQQKQKIQIAPDGALEINQGPFMGAGIFRLREDLFEQRELSER